MMQIIEDLETGKISGKFDKSDFVLPRNTALDGQSNFREIAVELLAGPISLYVSENPDLTKRGNVSSTIIDRVKQGFAAVDKLAAWLEKRHAACNAQL